MNGFVNGGRLTIGMLVFMVSAVSWGQQDHCLTERPKTYKKTESVYAVPAITLRDSKGEKVRLASMLDTNQPVILQFIFTTCTTICPVLSTSLANTQTKFENQDVPYRMISISIDPEYDTPKRLAAYAETFEAGSHWFFLTGSVAQIESVQKAFDAYYPGNNKMYHQPYTYLRLRRKAPWIRLEGLLSGQQLREEIQSLAMPARYR